MAVGRSERHLAASPRLVRRRFQHLSARCDSPLVGRVDVVDVEVRDVTVVDLRPCEASADAQLIQLVLGLHRDAKLSAQEKQTLAVGLDATLRGWNCGGEGGD